MNSNDCDQKFGAINVERVETFKINGIKVDFGDILHVGGAPQGDAVVCWLTDGRVAVIGRLFSDNFREPQTAIVEIRFRHTNGGFTNPAKRTLSTQGGLVTSKYVEKVSAAGNFDQVRIVLKVWQHTALGTTTTTLGTRTFTR